MGAFHLAVNCVAGGALGYFSRSWGFVAAWLVDVSDGSRHTTQDLDFVVQLPIESISNPVDEFRDDFYLDEQAVRAALTRPYQFNAIDNDQLSKSIFGCCAPTPFEILMFERRLNVNFLGERAWIATAEDVILHKLYWDSLTPSERQISDAAGVVAVQSDSLDRAYMQQWAGELGVSDKLNKLLTGEIKPKST